MAPPKGPDLPIIPPAVRPLNHLAEYGHDSDECAECVELDLEWSFSSSDERDSDERDAASRREQAYDKASLDRGFPDMMSINDLKAELMQPSYRRD